MRQVKDSGIEWIGEIPESWDRLKIKYISSISSGEYISKEEYEDNGLYPIIGANGEIGRTNKINNQELVVTTGRVGTIGTAHKVKEAWITDNVLIIGQIKVNVDFFRYSILNLDFQQMTSGTAMPLITATKIINQFIPNPTIEEQQSISAYLDRQCSLIDSVIEKTKASIEEYKKLRQAVITQAVTKGVRGDRAMKDSGIEWIGEIPQEWDIVKFKYIATVKSNLVHPNEYLNYMQIAPDNIEKGNAKLLECKTVEEIGIESDNHLFYKGQIIYSKIRPILNKVIIAPFDGLCSADMYPIETSINKYFLVYMMLSDRFLAQVKLVTENRVKMPKINQEELGQVLIYNPPIDEQQEIAEYLDKKCSEIDSLITKKEQFLTELDSYKKSLIYEYVTGKKEVPQA